MVMGIPHEESPWGWGFPISQSAAYKDEVRTMSICPMGNPHPHGDSDSPWGIPKLEPSNVLHGGDAGHSRGCAFQGLLG